jgi:hypothetical protein
MSYNGSGTFVINSAGQPVVTGTVISSTAFNALTADLATGLSTALTKDGQTTPTANLPMGTFKFTGMGAGSAATDSATISQVQSSFGSFLTVAGTDTITASVSPSLTAYATGQMFAFVAANTNTGAVTINISSLGAKSITKTGTTALVAGDLTANYLYVVVYDGTQFQVVGVSATTFTNLTVSGVLTLSGAGVQLNSSGTGAWKLPVGTTAQRPTGASGLIRQNSTTGNPEWYDTTSSSWLQFSQAAGYSINYLVVGGGAGGGGYNNGGGGGAGGLLASSITLSSGVSYTITVGAGGAGGATSASRGSNGNNSSISGISITALGGGGGGGFDGSSAGTAGLSGGSGGGGGAGSTTTGGSGSTGQGNAGGTGSGTAAGGGGGASGVGAIGSGTTGGSGGAGSSNSISGSALNYAGGGGGAANTTPGTGGTGGGGNGTVSSAGGTGTANTGGGGGGVYSGGSASNPGGTGGSGIVVIAYAGSQRGTGGTVTSSGGNTIHTFTSSGTYTA